MIENRPIFTFITHCVVLLGVLLVALPIWITFVAASHDEVRMLQSPMPMLPGPYLWDNLQKTLF
ncbi:MAG: glycerol-3-phosphate transporter, partial [Pseudomonadales bacterium]